MAILAELPGGGAGETVFNGLTKTVGASQSLVYSYASSLAGQPGDMLFGINNVNSTYVELPLAQQTVRFLSRYYVDPTGMTFGANDTHSLTRLRGTASSDTLNFMFWGNVTSTFGLLPTSYAEGATGLASQFIPVTKGPMYIEEDFLRSSGVGVSDAVYTVRVNGVQVYQRTGFINYTSFGLANKVWMGAVSGLAVGTSGSFTMGKILITNNAPWDGAYVPPPSGSVAVASQRLGLDVGIHF